MNLPSEVDEKAREYAEGQYPNDRNVHMAATSDAFKEGYKFGYKQGEKKGFLKAIEMLKEVNNNWAKNYLREKMGNEK